MTKQQILDKLSEYIELPTSKSRKRSKSSAQTLSLNVKRYLDSTDEYDYNTYLQWVGSLRYSDSTIAMMNSTVSSFLRDIGILTTEQVRRLSKQFKYIVGSFASRGLTDDNVKEILELAEIYDKKLVGVILLMAGSLTSLRIEQVMQSRLEGNVLIFPKLKQVNKGDDPYEYRSLSADYTVLGYKVLDVLSEQADESGRLVTVTSRTIYNKLKMIGAKCHLDLQPHDFRRYGITKVYDLTGDIALASQVACHSHIATTQRYIKGIQPRDWLNKAHQLSS